MINVYVTNTLKISFERQEGNVFYNVKILDSNYRQLPVGAELDKLIANWEHSYVAYNLRSPELKEYPKKPEVEEEEEEEEMPWN